MFTSVRAMAIICLLAAAGCGQQAEYPARPIELVVPWGAGGGTDAVGRMLANLLEQDLGKPVNVVNRIGGSGVVGHDAIASARPDGYTIGIITVEIAMMRHQGLTELSSDSYTPLALINSDPTSIQVRSDSPYQDLGDLIAAIRANPGRIKASGTAQGGIWHVALYGLLHDLGIPPASVVWVPSNGNAPAMLDLVAGGVDVVAGSLPEARSLIDAGKVRSLVVLDDRNSPLYPEVPTAKAAIDSDWTMGGWRGVAAPRGLPPEIEARLTAAVKKAYDSAEFRDFMESRGFSLRWAGPAEFAEYMAESDRQMGEAMKLVGLAK